jgi:imidazolonepropionase-like amidohydrolase
VIDCAGQTIMPALLSDHSHLGVVKGGKVSPDNYTKENIESALKQYEGYRVTAVLSLGVNKDVLYGWRAGKLEGADVFTADREAIQCATRNAAEVLGDLKNRGTLEPGKRADFLILNADPLVDIRNTTSLVAEPIFQEEAALRPAPAP